MVITLVVKYDQSKLTGGVSYTHPRTQNQVGTFSTMGIWTVNLFGGLHFLGDLGLLGYMIPPS